LRAHSLGGKIVIHLVCGPIGAGKTTVAHDLAEQHGAIRFSEDEWLSKLFIPDAPPDLIHAPVEQIATWASEKYLRCREQIWLLCEQLLSQGIPVVLDGGASTKVQREALQEKARQQDYQCQLYYVVADSEIRKSRVFDRNIAQGKTYSINVTPALFDLMETFFEPLTDEELGSAKLVRT